ncbi:hypothetical protein [Mesorhizobium sp. L48C026A00]|uniref:hypothetical protein n=1 Tax=Mesorhizobium sp. L48C026A00 TaxID=1287182 RepID=UPI0004CEEA75|nr:hypothetical protein [Mesorhizobium sp. L48C026A00]
MEQDNRQSSGGEAEDGAEKTWQISADGVAPEILDLASAWLNAGGGDPVVGLLLMSERLLTWRTFSSVGITRGALSVFPEPAGAEDEGE